MYFPTVDEQTLLSVVTSKKSIDKNIFKQGAYYHRYNMPSQNDIEKRLTNQEDIRFFVNNILQTQTEAFRHKVYYPTLSYLDSRFTANTSCIANATETETLEQFMT